MSLEFGHHTIPLLYPPQMVGKVGGKGHLAAVKEYCNCIKRVDGGLALAGRAEVAIIPSQPGFFDDSGGLVKARNHAWETMRQTPSLYWIILSNKLEQSTELLPPNWTGKGFKNVCLGLQVQTTADLVENIGKFQSAQFSRKLLHILPSSEILDLDSYLAGIDWVVFSGTDADQERAESLRRSCLKVGVAWHFHRTDDGGLALTGVEAGQAHPFGPKVDLARPTLPALYDQLAQFNSLRPSNNPLLEAAVSLHIGAINPNVLKRAEILALDFDIIAKDADTTDVSVEAVVEEETVTSFETDDTGDFARLNEIVRKSLSSFIAAGRALKEIRDRELWRRGGFQNWAEYCQTVGGMTKVHGNRLIRASEIADDLSKVEPIGFAPAAESQLRPLYRIDSKAQQAEAWSRAATLAGGQPSAKLLSQVVADLMNDPPEPMPTKKVDRNLAITDLIRRLRDAVRTKAGAKRIEDLLTELETKLLKAS
ncbi:MAG: DUF5131 family protein [Verrucomicrobiaceae bacterium]|nr:MAG: DUF5131 family protein [Verrucomicrobiaceae bacterium]